MKAVSRNVRCKKSVRSDVVNTRIVKKKNRMELGDTRVQIKLRRRSAPVFSVASAAKCCPMKYIPMIFKWLYYNISYKCMHVCVLLS